MEIVRKDFPEIMLDNDQVYLDHLIGVVDSIDELCSMEIIKKEKCFHFRIAPSVPKYIEPILYEILTFNNMFGIHLDLSKSMKASSTVTFDIYL
jgi:hypothetical protein